MLKSLLASVALLVASPLAAQQITVTEAYARVMGASATSGSAFMVIENTALSPDRLLRVETTQAERAEVHTHRQDALGVMQMIHLPEGLEIPAAGKRELARGGDHIMFMGLTAPLAEGDQIKARLIFDKAGPVEVEFPVRNQKPSGHGHH